MEGRTGSGRLSVVTVDGVLFDAFASSLEDRIGGGRRVSSDDHGPDDEEGSR